MKLKAALAEAYARLESAIALHPDIAAGVIVALLIAFLVAVVV